MKIFRILKIHLSIFIPFFSISLSDFYLSLKLTSVWLVGMGFKKNKNKSEKKRKIWRVENQRLQKSICLGSFTLGVLMVSTFVATSSLKI
jgi:hypothetical protein